MCVCARVYFVKEREAVFVNVYVCVQEYILWKKERESVCECVCVCERDSVGVIECAY